MNARQLTGSTLIIVLSGVLALGAEDSPLVLHDATPVRLRINRTLSSADATVGEKVDFEVLDEVKIGDTVVVAKGATAIATVTAAHKRRRMGRGGRLDLNVDFVRARNDDKIALRAVKDARGGGHVGLMTVGMVGTALVFFPVAPLFLLIQGKDITIPKGTEVTGYTNGETKFDPTALAAAPAPKLTNADIIALENNGFGDDVIISKIRTSGADFRLEVTDLLELKKANVPEGAISAMIEASKR